MINSIAKWLFDYKSDEVIELIKKEYEIIPETDLWEFRPSRIFFIKPDRENLDLYQKEYARFTQSLAYNYYLPNTITKFFSEEGDDEILEIISEPKKMPSGVYFPVVTKYSNSDYLPKVCFSQNKLYEIISKSNFTGLYRDDFNRLAKILDKITHKENKFQYCTIEPEIAHYQKIEGHSFELSLIIQAYIESNKSAFNLSRIPSICATGTIADNGSIGFVDYSYLKSEAAQYMGFDYIILPEACREDFKQDFDSDKTFFFSNLTQVIKWLETFSLRNQFINSIKDWLSGKANKPDAYCFSSFFNTQEKTNIDVWKTLLNGNTNQKIEQLKVLCNEYVQFKAIEPIKPSVFYENCKTDSITHFEDKNLELFNVCLNFWEKYQKNFANQEFLNSQAWQNHLEKEKVLPLLEKESKLLESLEQKVSNVDYLSDSEQFVFEFIRSFANSLEIDCIFRPVIWKNQYSRKLFSTIIIITLNANKDLLSRYIIENIEDLDSLLLSMQYV